MLDNKISDGYGNAIFNVGNLNQGLYLIKMKSDKNQIVRKFIKR
jgi:hypothetical protein